MSPTHALSTPPPSRVCACVPCGACAGTPLADAVRHGHQEAVRLLVSSGAQLGYDEVRMSGELCELARCGDVYRVELLLFAGCRPDAADYDLRTCLHLAASEGAYNVARKLIEHKATVDRRDR